MRAHQEILRESLVKMVEGIVLSECQRSSESFGYLPADCDLDAEWLEGAQDVHVGILTTSLGGHGAPTCLEDVPGRHNNDHAHLLPSERKELEGEAATEFLTLTSRHPDVVRPQLEIFREQVEAIGFDGCEFPAPLEVLYRFLSDVTPPKSIEVGPDGVGPVKDESGALRVDEGLLGQRARFLRPESSLSIFVITAQDDCSVMEGGELYPQATQGHRLLDPEETLDPDGAPHEQRLSLRCLQPDQRFGLDVLSPLDKYISALTRSEIESPWTGEWVENPLFWQHIEGRTWRRPPGRVRLSAIVGVPAIDLIDKAFDGDPIELRDGQDLLTTSAWDLLLGPMSEGGRSWPLDPFMIPSVAPRDARLFHPISRDPIVGPDSTSPRANPINGHEAHHDYLAPKLYSDGGPANDRLQSSCIYPLTTPLPACSFDELGCLCADGVERNDPICQPPGGGPADQSQYFAQATPAPRLLGVTEELGYSGQLAPICPFRLDEEALDFGYVPAIFDVLHDFIVPAQPFDLCLEGDGMVDEFGESCSLVEIFRVDDDSPSSRGICKGQGRRVLRPEVLEHLRVEMQARGFCGGDRDLECDSYVGCEIPQFRGDEAERCRSGDVSPADGLTGYCQLSGEENTGYSEVWCREPSEELRVIQTQPFPHERLVFALCQEEEVQSRAGSAQSSPVDIPKAPEGVEY